jgi:hypothetical protein
MRASSAGVLLEELDATSESQSWDIEESERRRVDVIAAL